MPPAWHVGLCSISTCCFIKLQIQWHRGKHGTQTACRPEWVECLEETALQRITKPASACNEEESDLSTSSDITWPNVGSFIEAVVLGADPERVLGTQHLMVLRQVSNDELTKVAATTNHQNLHAAW